MLEKGIIRIDGDYQKECPQENQVSRKCFNTKQMLKEAKNCNYPVKGVMAGDLKPGLLGSQL